MRVLISHAHADIDRRGKVLDLAARLRKQGIKVDCSLERSGSGPPDEGWKRWMYSCFRDADWILMLWSSAYRYAFDFRKGSGVAFEGDLALNMFGGKFEQRAKLVACVWSTGEQDQVALPWQGDPAIVLMDEWEMLMARIEHTSGQEDHVPPEPIKLLRCYSEFAAVARPHDGRVDLLPLLMQKAKSRRELGNDAARLLEQTLSDGDGFPSGSLHFFHEPGASMVRHYPGFGRRQEGGVPIRDSELKSVVWRARPQSRLALQARFLMIGPTCKIWFGRSNEDPMIELSLRNLQSIAIPDIPIPRN